MNLAVSALAWEANDSEHAFKLLKESEIHNIEGILTKIGGWDSLTDHKLQAFLKHLESNEIKMKSIQSIFYETDYRDITETSKIIKHFDVVIKHCKTLKIEKIVFGSPQIRKRVVGWEDKLSLLFKEVDSMLMSTKMTVLIEPNASIYGGEFFTNITDIVDFIKKNKLKNIATMIDTHNLLLEFQDPIRIFELYRDYIKHVHVSEKKLKPMVDKKFHTSFASALRYGGYEGTVTYEILPCSNLDKEVKLFSKIYKY